MRETVIVGAVRTPVGKRNGGLSDQHAADLSALVLNELVERTGVDPEVIDDVIWGCVSQVGDQSSNIGRYAVLAAGWPETHSGHHGEPGLRVQPAGPRLRRAGRDVRAAGRRGGGRRRGDEPGAAGLGAVHRNAVRPKGARPLRRLLVQPGHLRGADRAEVGLLPHALDEYSAQSHERAAAAQDAGAFADQIMPVFVDGGVVTDDEGIRRGTTVEKLAALKPAFTEDGVIHAGNSSQISDGAAALLVMTAENAVQLGLTPLVRYRAGRGHRRRPGARC